MESEEQVLVIPASEAEVFTKDAGLSFRSPDDIKPILSADTFIPRSIAESDPSHLQVIPYVLFLYQRHPYTEMKIFTYSRGKSGGEQRLHAKKSIGIGGHINSTDKTSLGSTFTNGQWREIHEEVRIADYRTTDIFATIYDPSNEVGRVHLGVLQVINLVDGFIKPKDPSIVESGLEPARKIVSEIGLYETWSQFVINGFIKNMGVGR